MFPSCCYSRPATSFRWFTSPLKTLRYIIWRNYKWIIIGVLITLLIVAAIVIFLYSMPVSTMFVNSWAVWTPGLVNQSQIYGSGQCIEIENKEIHTTLPPTPPIKCGVKMAGKRAVRVVFMHIWLVDFEKRNSVRGLVNQSVLTNFAVYSGTMVYRIKWNEIKWKLLIGSQLTLGKKKKHWWPYGTRSVPNTLVY